MGIENERERTSSMLENKHNNYRNANKKGKINGLKDGNERI